MCIRDRAYTFPKFYGTVKYSFKKRATRVKNRDKFLILHRNWTFFLKFLFWTYFGGLAQLARACLLYTSDAADERSSVDLGGRRIIKKKKH